METIHLGYNVLESLPRELGDLPLLHSLSLENNHLHSLPVEMGKLWQLERLVIAGNRELSSPPAVILRQGTTGILSYMRRILKGMETLHFDLSGLGLSVVPIDVCREYTQLTELDLGDNKISMLPKAIENLTNMVMLRLDGNPIHKLEPSMGNLTALTELFLDDFKNIKIPPPEINERGLGVTLKYLKRIAGADVTKKLDLSYMGLKEIPQHVLDMHSLSELSLTGNQLRTLPINMSRLVGLNELWLHNNRLESLPESIGFLTHLNKLLLDSNNLTTLPSSLGMLTSLARLSLTNNMLRALPAELGLLSTTLETLAFQNNKSLSSPPPEIQAEGSSAVLDYLRRMLESARKEAGVLDMSGMVRSRVKLGMKMLREWQLTCTHLLNSSRRCP